MKKKLLFAYRMLLSLLLLLACVWLVMSVALALLKWLAGLWVPYSTILVCGLLVVGAVASVLSDTWGKRRRAKRPVEGLTQAENQWVLGRVMEKFPQARWDGVRFSLPLGSEGDTLDCWAADGGIVLMLELDCEAEYLDCREKTGEAQAQKLEQLLTGILNEELVLVVQQLQGHGPDYLGLHELAQTGAVVEKRLEEEAGQKISFWRRLLALLWLMPVEALGYGPLEEISILSAWGTKNRVLFSVEEGKTAVPESEEGGERDA